MALLIHIWEVQLEVLACGLVALMRDLMQPVKAHVMIVPPITCRLFSSTAVLSDAAQKEVLTAFVNRSHFNKVKSRNQSNYRSRTQTFNSANN